MKKEIKELILNNDYTAIDKLIGIYKMVDEENDLKSLSKSLNIDQNILSLWTLNKKVKPIKKDNGKKGFQDYVDLFHNKYYEKYEIKFKWTKKELQQTKNLMKQVDFKSYEKILDFIFFNIESNVKNIDFNLKCVIEHLSPSIIVNKLNYLLRKIGNNKNPKEWGY